MKWIIFFLISFPAIARECALYELQGVVSKKGLRVALTVNSETNSQREFIFSRKIEIEMAPYFDRTVRGSFVTDKLQILKIEEVKFAVPDPLYRLEEMAKKKTIPCPK